jgi:hypothetical protein
MYDEEYLIQAWDSSPDNFGHDDGLGDGVIDSPKEDGVVDDLVLVILERS